jgi:hypothetical protein
MSTSPSFSARQSTCRSTWPDEVTVDDVSRGQWGETVKRFLTAA